MTAPRWFARAVAVTLVVLAGVAAGARPAAAQGASPDSGGLGWRTSAGILPKPAPPIDHDRSLRTLFVPSVHPEFARLAPGWRGAAFVVAAGGVDALVGAHDVSLADHVTAGDSRARRQLASWVKPLGNEVVIGGGIAAWGLAWLSNRDALFQSVQRADLAIAAAGVCTLAGKRLVGRKRPYESPGDASAFKPFSGHDSFPSGHSTLAFATVTAIDRETPSRWVPAIGYPLAALIAWSRIHDRQHWPSDVVAGAAVGFGVASKVEDALRPRPGEATGVRLELGSGDGALMAVRLRW